MYYNNTMLYVNYISICLKSEVAWVEKNINLTISFIHQIFAECLF